MPVFGVAVTVGAYAVALVVRERVRWLHPFVLMSALLFGVVLAVPLSVKAGVEAYNAGGDMLRFWLGPATVALAVPLYKRLPEIRAELLAVLGSVACGGLAAIVTGWAMVHALGGERVVELSMLSRSVTTPISVAIAGELHADVNLAATFTVVSGLFGGIVGPVFLRRVGIGSDLALGLGIGTAAHGLGTASVIRRSEAQGAAAGLAMALNGVVTSVMMVPVVRWMGGN
jgi:putative effector of murein hydrolase